MLAQNSSLERLRIERNAIGDQGIAHLAESLKKSQTLKELDISYCGITDTGLAAAAKVLRPQRRLDIVGDVFGLIHNQSMLTMEYSQTGK